MNKKRLSPTEKDMERIAETLRNTDGGHKIKDNKTFNEAWDDYFQGNTEGLGGNKDFRDSTFHQYASDYPDRLFDSVISKKELKGEERERVKMALKPKRDYNIIAREKGRVVYTYKELIKVRGKDAVRYRDRYGRFAGLKKNKNE